MSGQNGCGNRAWQREPQARAADRGRWASLVLAIGLVGAGLCLLGTEHRYGRATVQPVATVRPAADSGPAAGSPRMVARPIERLRAGDRVLALDPGTGAMQLKPVRRVFQRCTHHLRELAIESADDSGRQWITTTDEHPFWVVGKGWVTAADLVVGDRLRQADGRAASVVESQSRQSKEAVPVYNLEVDRWHTYFVSADERSAPLLVHNCNPDSFGKLYHYTSAAPGEVLARGLLPGASGKVFLTPNPTLSPLQAHLGLALPPNRGLPQHLLEIDVATLRELGVEVSQLRRVGRRFNLPGGELEATVSGAIPAAALRPVR